MRPKSFLHGAKNELDRFVLSSTGNLQTGIESMCIQPYLCQLISVATFFSLASSHFCQIYGSQALWSEINMPSHFDSYTETVYSIFLFLICNVYYNEIINLSKHSESPLRFGSVVWLFCSPKLVKFPYFFLLFCITSSRF